MELKEILIELKDVGADLVNEFFPKGECKERGQALVLYAKLLIRFRSYLGGLWET